METSFECTVLNNITSNKNYSSEQIINIYQTPYAAEQSKCHNNAQANVGQNIKITQTISMERILAEAIRNANVCLKYTIHTAQQM